MNFFTRASSKARPKLPIVRVRLLAAFSSAIKAAASSVVIVHNHPSGDCMPSKEDEEVTKILCDAGDILGIKVLDHVIISKDGFVGLKEKCGL